MSSKSKHLKLIVLFLLLLLGTFPFEFSFKLEIQLTLIFLSILFLFIHRYTVLNKQDSKEKILNYEIQNLKLKQQFQDLVYALPAPLVIIDHNTNILLSNSGFKQLFPNHLENLKNIEHSIKNSINQAILNNSSTRQTIYINHREYQMISNHLTFDDFFGTMLLFNDVTVFVEAQKAQKRFIADASHELKTPITSIKGMTEILLDREVDGETTREFHQQISKEALRLQTIVTDLLELSKLSNNRIILNYSSFNFSDLVKEVYHSLKSLISQKGLNFDYDFLPRYVYMDYSKMTQVLTNLLTNSIDFSDKGTLYLKTYIEQSNFFIRLEDEGVGIDPKHLNNIFDRFYRIDQSRVRQIGGSGLGLSIVKEIVEAHHGSIKIQSVLNQGTVILVKIPLSN